MEAIYEYTAADAVRDEVLFDAYGLPEGAPGAFREMFQGLPVYLTVAVRDLMSRAVAHPRHCNDWGGVAWDLCWMSRGAVAKAQRQARRRGIGRATYQVIITGTGRSRCHDLDVVITGEGLTFALQGED